MKCRRSEIKCQIKSQSSGDKLEVQGQRSTPPSFSLSFPRPLPLPIYFIGTILSCLIAKFCQRPYNFSWTNRLIIFLFIPFLVTFKKYCTLIFLTHLRLKIKLHVLITGLSLDTDNFSASVPNGAYFIPLISYLPTWNTKNKQNSCKTDEGWLVTRKQGGRLLRCPWNPRRPPTPYTSQPSGLNSKWISSPVVTQADFVYASSDRIA